MSNAQYRFVVSWIFALSSLIGLLFLDSMGARVFLIFLMFVFMVIGSAGQSVPTSVTGSAVLEESLIARMWLVGGIILQMVVAAYALINGVDLGKLIANKTPVFFCLILFPAFVPFLIYQVRVFQSLGARP